MCVCVCVCARARVCRLLLLLKDESSASQSFYRLLVMFSWILIPGFVLLGSRVMPSFAYFEYHRSAGFSEEHVAKLVHGVLLLYSVVSSALER